MAAEILASAEDCRSLFERMGQLRTLAPWDWMEETDLFGVQDPETGEIGFVSIMGMAGEHYAVAVYQGARGLYGFWHMQETGPFLEPQDMFNTPQLQASFEDREMLEKGDLSLIRALGLKYRGRNAWPMFRSYRPGYAPWYIEPAEARFLAHVLGQVQQVAPRVRQNPDILEPGGDTDYLVRTAQKLNDDWVWRDEMRSIAPPPLIGLTIEIDPELLAALKQLPKERYKLEADFFMSPAMVGAKNERPYFPYILMMLDATHDVILGMEMLSPVPALEQMWGQVGLTALRMLARTGALPTEIRIRDALLYGMLVPFAKELHFKVTRVQRLPLLDHARADLEGYLRR